MSEDVLIACEGCGEVHERASKLIAELRAANVSLGTVLGRKDARITELEGHATQGMRTSKHIKQASEVLTYWQKVVMPTAREPMSDDRLERVQARLAGGFTVDELKKCADGYAKRPYVVDGKRMSTGRRSEWQADAELIYRTPKHVEKGMALADLARPEAEPTDIGHLDWRKVRDANFRTIMQALRAAGLEPYENYFGNLGGYRGEWICECPKCKGKLYIYEPSSNLSADRGLLSCQDCGIDERIFFAALRETDAPPAPTQEEQRAAA